uniref:Ycf2 n=1 Tax=Porella perrottetiana TaxID=460663 RepID=A0A4Y5P5P1_9MARC|nr:Ycf2 [Porella perrottetiana]QCW58582.1 Ycf2 [Porella perrottetiana]
MKQKLSEKKSSHKIRKNEILSNSWTKCGLIGLLITKFFDSKNLRTSFDFRMVTLSHIRNSRNDKIFILNTLMLFALPVLISIYRSTSINIVVQNKFDLIKIQKRVHRRKDFMGIYIKPFQSLNKNFHIFPRNLFILNEINKKSKKDFFSDIIPVFNKEILLEVDYSFEKEKYESIYGLDFSKKIFDFYISAKKIINRDHFWLRKEILQNLRNWGESDEILIKSSFLLKEKGNLYLLNYIKFNLWQLIRNNFCHFGETKRKYFTEKTFKYFYSENNPRLFITLEKILSDSIYQFSKYLSYEARKDRILNTNSLLIKKWNRDINSIDLNYAYIDGESRKNIEFINSINLDQFRNWNINKYDFGWIKKILHIGNRVLVKPIFIHRISLNQSFFSSRRKPDSYLDFFEKPRMHSNGNFFIKRLFSQLKIKTINPQKSIRYAFIESLLINEFNQNTVSNKDWNKIFKNMGKIQYLKNNIESDDVETISWKTQIYYSNFLLNYSLPFNVTYNMIRQNHSMNKEILYIFQKRWDQSFFEILHLLLPIYCKFKEFFLFLNRIELEEHLIEKNNELNLLIDVNKIKKDQNLIKKLFLLLISKRENNDNNNNESINYYLFSEDTIETKLSNFYNSIQNFSKLLNKPYSEKALFLNSKKIYSKKYRIHGYSITWEGIVKKSFMCNITDIEYKKWTLQVYEWLNAIKNLNTFHLSKQFVPDNFFMKVKSPKIFPIFFRKFDLEYIDKILNFLRLFIKIHNKDVGQNNLFNKFDKSISSNFLTHSNLSDKDTNKWIPDSPITGINNAIYINSLGNSFSFRNILSNSTKNEELFSISNYNERFLFHWKKMNLENNNTIYSKFLRNLSKYNKIDPIVFGIKSLFLREKILRLAQLRLTNISFSKMAFKIFDETKFILSSHFYQKLSSPNNLYLSSSSDRVYSKQETNEIEDISYYRFSLENLFIGISSEKIVKGILVPQLNKIRIENFYNILRSESVIRSENRNSKMFQSINNIFLHPRSKDFKLKNLKYKIGNRIPRNTDKFYKHNQFEIASFFAKYFSFKNYNYTSWFFTSEWWKYNIHVFVESFRKNFLIIGYHLEYFVDDYIEVTRKNLINFWEKGKNLHNLNLKWNSRLFLDYNEEILSNFVWSDFQLINNWNSLYWAFFGLITIIYLFYQNCSSILIGSDCIDLWKYFETIKYLKDTSRAFYLTKLINRNKTQSNKTENLVIYFFSHLKYYAKNIRFYLLIKKKLEKWLMINKSLDLSRRKRNLLVQSLITHTRIKRYGFQSYPKQKLFNNESVYRGNSQQGLSYLQYLVGVFKKNLVNYPSYLADKWIFFASLQKILSSQTLRQTKRFNPRFQKIPIPLQFGLSCSKGILLIGPIETGRSYLIKNLAADSYIPLLGISINKLLYNKPDVITESWMNILIESLRRLNLTLDLAKGMSPCIIWMRNIHQLDVNRSTQNIESDPTFLLGILLKHFQTDSTKKRIKNNIIIIGSTHVPKKVDPSLISPDRLDRIINIRLFNTLRRSNQFPILLNKNNLQLKKNLLHFNDLGSRTVGYNMRDLAAFTNEISLISLTKNESFVYKNTIKLAFHRQVLGFTYTNNRPNFRRNFKILLYKIGRAIIQNILIEGSPINPLNISNYLWKRKFYYLFKWYSEPSIDESIVKESTIIVHVLGCLAGIAARDSWFFSEKKDSSDTSIPLDKSVENDLDLAFSILESFSIEFPWLETCKTQFINYRQKKPKTFSTNSLNIMQSGIFAIANRSFVHTHNDSEYESLVSQQRIINRKGCEFKKTAWSPRFWRLSFSRSHLFNWIKRPNDFEFFHNFRFSKKNDLERKNHYDPLMDREKEQLLYERILPRVRKRNVRELEYQFEKILLEEQFEILGFFRPSTQYQMEHQLGNEPRLFIGKRILWDPTGSLSRIRHFVFSRRDFFVDEEMLRRLYVTYGVRRERERSLSSHRIKRFFVCRGYNKDLVNKLSVRWWNQLPIDQKQNIYTLKHIEKIGIRLKHPQIFTPVYLYQRWLIENIPEKFSRLKLLTHRNRWLKINKLLLNDSFTYTTLLESYQYLFEFFLSNKLLLNQMIKILLKKKWLFQNEIGDIIHNIIK